MKLDIICVQVLDGKCGFRVHDRYFVQKKRFAAGICPRCGSPTRVVEQGTNRVKAFTVSLASGEVTADTPIA